MRELTAHPAQASAHFHQAAAPPAAHCVQLSLSLGERSAPGDLQAAWQKLVAAHGMLRSGFRKGAGAELMRREFETADEAWQVLDWQGAPPTDIPARWTALRDEQAAQPFDLGNPPLIRCVVILLPGGHNHLLLTFPRFLLDEDSLFHLICEWLEALEGAHPAAESGEETPVPAVTQAVTDWWKQFFAGSGDPVRLSVCPPPTGSGHRHQDYLFDRETTRSLKRLAQRLGLETSDILLAAWGLVLGRLTSQRRVLLLAPCRLTDTLGCGFFDNFLPTHLTINGGQSVEAWLKTVARESAERLQNAGVPLERVLQLAQPALTPDRLATGFFWLPPPLNDRIHDTYPRWINSDAQIHRTALLPLALEARDGNRIGLRLTYDTATLRPADAERLLGRLTGLLDDFLAGPTRRLSELRILGAAEWDTLRQTETVPALRDCVNVEEQIARAITRTPDGAAAEGPGDSILTFTELDAHAHALASWLRQENIADGWNIAVCLNQTAWLPVAILGSLRAGDTCIPFEPGSDATWLAQRLEGYDIELVICDSGTAPQFEGGPRKRLVIDQQWETVAAVPATPASQKQPKVSFVLAGTEKSDPPVLNALHPRTLAAAVDEAVELLHLEPGARLPLSAPAGTGAFLDTVLAALASGATLMLSQEEIPETATHLRLTSGQWRVWLADRRRSGDLPEPLRCVCVDGAPYPAAVLAGWQALDNGRTRWVTVTSPAGLCGLAARSQPADRRGATMDLPGAPIGAAGPGMRVRLGDFEGQPLAAGFPGTLEIAFDREADRKISLPAWRDSSGSLFFTPSPTHVLEDTLAALPGVLDVCVVADGASPPAAWVVRADRSTEVPSGWKDALPGPVQFLLATPSFPLDAAGRIDGSALPRPQVAARVRPESPATPAPAREWSPLTAFNTNPEAPRLFVIHDLEGDPNRYRALAGLLAADWAVHATAARGLHQPASCHSSLESEAAALIEAICLLDPSGPYHLMGHGYGGILAFEMARQLRVAGREVPYLALAGTRPPAAEETKPSGWLQNLTRVFRKAGTEAPTNPEAGPVERAHLEALSAYKARPLAGEAGIILGADQGEDVEDAWLELLPDAFIERMSCHARDMLVEPSVKRLAVILRDSFVLPEDGEE